MSNEIHTWLHPAYAPGEDRNVITAVALLGVTPRCTRRTRRARIATPA